MMRLTHSPAASEVGEADQHGARGLGLLQDAHRHLGDDAEQALRPGDDAEQVVALGIEMLAADADHFAGDQHDLAAEHVVGGHAVFQAVHAAGILRDVAADGAGDLRGGIGRVVEAFVRDGLADREVRDARLDHRDAVFKIDLADAVEFAHAEQHAVGKRQCAAGERGARPARHHADAVLVAIAQHAADLFGGLRQHHKERKLPIGREPVGLVRAHLALVRDDALARHDRRQRAHDLGAPRQHGRIGLGHPQ